MLGEIQDKYEAWYKIWCEVYVPKLMAQKNNFKNSRDLQVDDLVYYQKSESELSSPWIMGKVDQIIRGRDGVIRRVIIKYSNSSENEDRTTNRTVRKLVKLYSADDSDLHADLGKLQARIEQLQGLAHDDPGLMDANAVPASGDFNNSGLQVDAEHGAVLQLCYPETGPSLRCQCCCPSHCSVFIHNLYGSKTYFHPESRADAVEMEAVFNKTDDQPEIEADFELASDEPDNLTALLMSVNRNLDF
jgi:hypothetical protein